MSQINASLELELINHKEEDLIKESPYLEHHYIEYCRLNNWVQVFFLKYENRSLNIKSSILNYRTAKTLRFQKVLCNISFSEEDEEQLYNFLLRHDSIILSNEDIVKIHNSKIFWWDLYYFKDSLAEKNMKMIKEEISLFFSDSLHSNIVIFDNSIYFSFNSQKYFSITDYFYYIERINNFSSLISVNGKKISAILL